MIFVYCQWGIPTFTHSSPASDFPAILLELPAMLAYVVTVNLPDGVARKALSAALSIFVSLLVGVPFGLCIALLVALIS